MGWGYLGPMNRRLCLLSLERVSPSQYNSESLRYPRELLHRKVRFVARIIDLLDSRVEPTYAKARFLGIKSRDTS